MEPVERTLPVPPLAAATHVQQSVSGWYVTGLLFLIGAFNLMDRQILAILLEPIKRDLNVSDTAMGLLTGFAFVALYALTSVPIARLADTCSRRNIVALALAFWSLLTAASALATSFVQLAALRIGVGVAESATGPAGQSLVADFFSPRHRTAAMSLLAIAPPVGVMLAFITGGALNDAIGWRRTLMCVGLPGVALALLWWLTVREPERGVSEHRRSDVTAYDLRAVLHYLLQLRSLRYMTLGASLSVFAVTAMVVWSPAYFARLYSISTSSIGLSLGLATGAGGIAGGLSIGLLSQRLAKRDLTWLMRLPALSSLAGVVCVAGFLQLGSSPFALLMFFGITFCTASMLGPVMSATQTLAKVRMRAVAAALVTLGYNFIGTGFAPFAVGIVSDRLSAQLGTGSLRAALWLAALANLGAALAFAAAARHVRADIEGAGSSKGGRT